MPPEATAITRAPFHFASCTAKCPTPPAAPLTSTVVPGDSGTGSCTRPVKGEGTLWPRSMRNCQAVSSAIGAPAARTWSSAAGLCARSEAGAATYSA